jgi:hypothetical protein
MNDGEHPCQLPIVAERSPHIQRGYRAKSDDVAKDDRVSRRGRRRVSSHPVEDRDRQERAAKEPQIGDQRAGGVGGDGITTDNLWSKDEAEARERRVDRGNAEERTESHGGVSFRQTIEMAYVPV